MPGVGWMVVQEVSRMRGSSRLVGCGVLAPVDQERHQSIVAFDLRWREPPLQDVSCVGPPGHGCRLAGVVAQGSAAVTEPSMSAVRMAQLNRTRVLIRYAGR
jgi:hypothetical protein